MRRLRMPTALVPGFFVTMVLVAGLLASCNPTSADDKRAGAPPEAGHPADVDLRDQRLRAMIAVRCHAYVAADRLPQTTCDELGLPPLSDAVTFLFNDSANDPLARSRRRRAIALLAGFGGQGPEAAPAWRRLVDQENTANHIEGALHGEAASTPEDRAAKVFEMLGEAPVGMPGPGGETNLSVAGCGPTGKPKTTTSTKDGIVQTRTTISVTRSIDKVRRSLDPQSWDRCSLFFEPEPRTYLVKGPIPSAVAPCNELPKSTDPDMDNSVPAGTAYESRHLFEHASCVACKSEFKNILLVSATAGERCLKTAFLKDECTSKQVLYETCYDLAAPLGACVQGKELKLITDSGHLNACLGTNPGEIEVTATKNIESDSPTMNNLTFSALSLTADELVAGITEIACCE